MVEIRATSLEIMVEIRATSLEIMVEIRATSLEIMVETCATSLEIRSGSSVEDNTLDYQSRSIPRFSRFSDETLNRDPVSL